MKNNEQTERKAYAAPKLTVYGAIAQITAQGGSGDQKNPPP